MAGTLLLSGCSALPKEEQTLAPPLVKPQKAQYELYEVTRKDITKMINGNGSLISIKENNLFTKENGKRIKKINVKYGQAVKKGESLIEFDSEDVENDIKLQKIEVEKSEIRYERSSQGSDEYDKKLSLLDVKSAKARLEALQQKLESSKLIAEVSGMATFVETLKEGDVAEAYKTLVTISDPKALQVLYQTQDIGNVKNGMKAELTFKGKKYEGVVAQIPTSGVYKDSIIVDFKSSFNEGNFGDTIELAITLETKKNTLVVPKAAVKSFMGSNIVEILDDNKKVSLDVDKGIESNNEVEILSGLKEGQKAIIN